MPTKEKGEFERVGQAIAEKFHYLDIEYALFDLDDTFLDTRKDFLGQEDKFFDLVSKATGIDRSRVKDDFMKLNNELYFTMSVNPKRFDSVTERLIDQYGETYREVFMSALPLLHDIYKIPPKLLKGALYTIKAFAASHVKRALVTHANQEWTDFKVDYLGLRKYFDHIEIVDEDKHKGEEDWGAAMEKLGADPESVFVVGDNLQGDIIAAYHAGVKRLFWIDPGHGWEMYRTGEVPAGVTIIKGINELIPKILTLPKGDFA